MNTTHLKDLFENEEYDRLITYLREAKLEAIDQTYILSKLFTVLEQKNKLDILIEILYIIARYKINVFDYELKEGIRILICHQKLEDSLQIISILIEHKKVIDEYVVISLIGACFSNDKTSLIEKCFNMIGAYYKINSNVSHSFWQTSIEGLVKNKQHDYANKLLKLYPIKYSYSESLWKNVILSNASSESIFSLFDMFNEKFDSRTNNNDEYRAFESIFNIFIEEIANHYHLLSQVKIEALYDVIIKKKICLKENLLEMFFVKVVKNNLSNFEKVQNFIFKCDCLLTPKVIEKIILEYSKLNDYFAIFTILKLCKCKKIPVPYDILDIPANVLKDLLQFIMNNTQLNFEDSFYSALSEDNKYYVLKNFKCTNSKDSINIGEEVEKDDAFIIKKMKEEVNERKGHDNIEDEFVIY